MRSQRDYDIIFKELMESVYACGCAPECPSCQTKRAAAESINYLSVAVISLEDELIELKHTIAA